MATTMAPLGVERMGTRIGPVGGPRFDRLVTPLNPIVAGGLVSTAATAAGADGHA